MENRPIQNKKLQVVSENAFKGNAHFQRHGLPLLTSPTEGPAPYAFVQPSDPHKPKDLFEKLRWGGQVVFFSDNRKQVNDVYRQYVRPESGFVIDKAPATVKYGLRIPFFGKQVHYFIARRTELIMPGDVSYRFTFDVKLVRDDKAPGGYAVLKQIPSRESVIGRLQEKFSGNDKDFVAARAHKLMDHVFPVFLTREVAFLRLLEKHLPAKYHNRFPKLINVEKGPNGMVQKLWMTWLRQGENTLSQVEFAKQSTEMLSLLHEQAKIIHLDLRLDNILITKDGVCIIDFGSAVRVGEDFKEASMLQALFNQMMSTSQVQQTMGKLVETGHITSSEIINAHQKIDKAADLFYLAFQFSRLHKHPDFQGLVHFDPESEEAKKIKVLADEVMRPPNPNNPTITNSTQLLKRLLKLEQSLNEENDLEALNQLSNV